MATFSSTRRFNRLPRIATAMVDKISKVNRAAGFNVQQRAVMSFSGTKHGNRYRLAGWRGNIIHQASMPGEPPAVMYGNLSNSIFVDAPDAFTVFVYTTDEKAPYLEYGTTIMEARPWLVPAMDEESRAYTKALQLALQLATKA